MFIGRQVIPLTRPTRIYCTRSHLYYAKVNGSRSMTTLFFKQWNCQVHYFLLIQLVCEINFFHLFLLHGETYKQIFINFHPVFNQIEPKFNGLVLGLWQTLPQTYKKNGPILFGMSWRQTNRQTDRRKNITCWRR